MFKFTLKDLFIIITYICLCLGGYKLALTPFADKKYDIKEMLRIPTNNLENNIKLKDALLQRDNQTFLLSVAFLFNFMIIPPFVKSDNIKILLIFLNLFLYIFLFLKEVLL